MNCPVCKDPLSSDKQQNVWHIVAAHVDWVVAGKLLEIAAKQEEQDDNNTTK